MANNIIKRIWNQNTLVNIEALKGAIFQDEDGGHTFEISGVDNSGNAISLSGTVAGVFLRPDNTDVPITGSASGGIVSVTLPAECYDVSGRFGLTVFVTADSKNTCVYAASGTVGRTSSGSVAPGTSADVVDLINQISAAVATIPASWSGLMADIAPTYSTSAAYPVGAYVYYNGDLYRCTTAITTGETWTAAHWTTAVLGNDVSDLKTATNNYPGIVAELGMGSVTSVSITETRGKFINGAKQIINTSGSFAISQPIAVTKDYHYIWKGRGTTAISAITKTDSSGTPISVVQMYTSSNDEQIIYTPDANGYIVVSFEYTVPYSLGYVAKGTFKTAVEEEIADLWDGVNQYDNIPLNATYDGVLADLGSSKAESIAITETQGKFINNTPAVITTTGNYAISQVISATAGKHYVLRATGTPNICAICRTDSSGNPLSVIKSFQTNRPETVYFTAEENIYFVVSFEYTSNYYLESFDVGTLAETVADIVNSKKNLVADFIHNSYQFQNGYFNYNQLQIVDTNLFRYRYVPVNPATDKYLKYSYTIESSATAVYVACFLTSNNQIIKDNILTYTTAGTFSGQIPVPKNASKIIFSLRSNNATFKFYLLKEHTGNSFDTVFGLASSGVRGENRVGGYIARNNAETPAILEHTENGYAQPYYDANATKAEFGTINTKPYDAQTNVLNSLPYEEVDFTPSANGFTRIVCGKSDDDLFFVSYEAGYRTGTPGAEIFNKLEATRDFVTFTPVFRAYDDDTQAVQNVAYVDGLTHMHIKLVKQFANGNYLCVINAQTARDTYATAFVLLSADFETATEIVTMEDPNAGGAYDWHLDIKGSKAIVATYGTRLPETDLGKVWYTEDNGETWKLVFQMPNHYNDGVDSADPVVTKTHVHGVMLDEFSGRMFVIAGEDNRNIFWNDHGTDATDSNWNVIPIRNEMQTNLQQFVQVVNGYAFRDSLIFGSDNPNIGCIYRINKLDGKTYSDIEIAHEILPNYFTGYTYYCSGEMFRRDNNSPLFLCMTRENNMSTEANNELLNQKHLGRVLATYDGINFAEVWKDDTYGSHSVYMDGSVVSKNFAYCTRGMNCYLLKNGDVVIKYSGRENYFFGGADYPTGYSNACCKVRIIKNAEKYVL